MGPRWYRSIVPSGQPITHLHSVAALKFDPDRFLDERLHKYLMPNPFIFCPFNAGPRICIGQQFAYHEATFFLVRLMQRFTGFRLDQETNNKPPAEWATGDGTQPMEKIHPLSYLTMCVKACTILLLFEQLLITSLNREGFGYIWTDQREWDSFRINVRYDCAM